MKHKTIVRRRRADDDIETAIAFYLEEAGTDVAMDLANHLQEALRKISRQPTIGSTRYGEIPTDVRPERWSAIKTR